MDRSQLEHALRAAKEITGEKDFIVIGSCSILAQYPKEGIHLTRYTEEIDIYPREKPEKSEMLNVIGYRSAFQTTHSFYIDPVGPTTAVLPDGWEDRLVKVTNKNTNHAIGWCLDVHDLAVAKLAAHRGKDLDFIEELLRENLVNPKLIRERLEKTRFAHHELKKTAIDYLDRCVQSVGQILSSVLEEDVRKVRNKQKRKSRGPEMEM